METKGKGLIKLSSVIMIVLGTFASIIYALGLIMGSTSEFINSVFPMKEVDEKSLFLIFGLGLVWAVFELIVGIVGIINAGKAEKSMLCLVLGIILIAISLVSTIGAIVTTGPSTGNVVAIFLGILFPVLFSTGAYLNKAE